MHGRHIKVIGRGRAPKLGDVSVVTSFLRNLVHAVGMRPLGAPIVYDVPLEITRLKAVPFEDEGGVTGITVLSTSHVSIHTWPLRGLYVLDVYSCRDFRDSVVTMTAATYFGIDKMRVTDLSHSLTPPPDE